MGTSLLSPPPDYHEPLYRVMRICILLSILLHLLFVELSDFLFLLPADSSPPPIRVSLADPTQPKQESVERGRIEDLGRPELQEKPEEADILARTDSRAHSRAKGAQYQGQKTVVPAQKIDPVQPATKKGVVSRLRRSPEKSRSKVAALVEKQNKESDRPTVTEVDLFATTRLRQSRESEQSARSEEFPVRREAQSPKLSAKATDQPAPTHQERERLTGAERLKGPRSETYQSSKTRDGVIDMGDGSAIVSLNSRSFKYIDYFESIRRAIELVWSYPEQAALGGATGVTVTLITLSSRGELLDVQVRRSSGYKSLDDETLMAIKTAAPYPPFPAGIKYTKLHIYGSFIYENSYSAIR